MLRLEIENGELIIEVNKENVNRWIFDLAMNKKNVEVGMKTPHGHMTIVFTEEQVQKLIDHLVEVKENFEDHTQEKWVTNLLKTVEDKEQFIDLMSSDSK